MKFAARTFQSPKQSVKPNIRIRRSFYLLSQNKGVANVHTKYTVLNPLSAIARTHLHFTGLESWNRDQ